MCVTTGIRRLGVEFHVDLDARVASTHGKKPLLFLFSQGIHEQGGTRDVCWSKNESVYAYLDRRPPLLLRYEPKGAPRPPRLRPPKVRVRAQLTPTRVEPMSLPIDPYGDDSTRPMFLTFRPRLEWLSRHRNGA